MNEPTNVSGERHGARGDLGTGRATPKPPASETPFLGHSYAPAASSTVDGVPVPGNGRGALRASEPNGKRKAKR
jgi:hypothetical protein